MLNDELAAYYAQMAKEKEKEAREDRDAEESSGEDDDADEFEDVGIGGGTSAIVDTPSSSQSATGGANGFNDKAMVSGALQSFASESGSSAPATGISTPMSEGAGGADRDGPELKRLKTSKVEMNGAGGVSDEDDEAEFEDAL